MRTATGWDGLCVAYDAAIGLLSLDHTTQLTIYVPSGSSTNDHGEGLSRRTRMHLAVAVGRIHCVIVDDGDVP